MFEHKQMNDSVRCALCHSDEKIQLFESIDIKQSKEKFAVVQCGKCNLIYTDNVPSFEAIVRYYSASYYSYNKKFDIPENSLENGKKYLDIGCGAGWHLVDQMKEGYDTYGIEIDPNVVKSCQDRGLKVKQSIQGRIDYESDFFDVIHLNHVLEHLHSLERMMSEIYRCLKKGGFPPEFSSYPSAGCEPRTARGCFGKNLRTFLSSQAACRYARQTRTYPAFYEIRNFLSIFRNTEDYRSS